MASSLETINPVHRYHWVHLTDVEPKTLSDVICDSNLDHHFLGDGPYEITHERIACTDLTIDVADYRPALFAIGTLAAKPVTIGLVLRSPTQPVRISGRAVMPGELQLYAPGKDLVYQAGPRSAWGTVAIDEERLSIMARNICGREPDKLGSGARYCVGTTLTRAAIHTSFRAMLASHRTSNNRASTPDIQAQRFVVDRFLTCLITAIDTQHGCEAPHEQINAAKRRLLRDTVRLIESDLAQPFSMAALCEKAGLSARTVQLTFHDTIGISPCRWQIEQRLMRVRRDLQRADPADRGVITRVALRWGFTHLGHFSQQFRRTFGQTPRQTMLNTSLCGSLAN